MGALNRGPVPYLIIAAGVVSMAWLAWRFLPKGEADPESAESLRAVLEKGDSSEQRSLAAAKLGEMGDEESMPLLFRAMEDAAPIVRGQAGAAVQKIMKADYYFRANDPLETRQAIIAKIKKDWDAYLQFKSPEPATSSGS